MASCCKHVDKSFSLIKYKEFLDYLWNYMHIKESVLLFGTEIPFHLSSLYMWSVIQNVLKRYLCLTNSRTGCLCLLNATLHR